MANPQMASLLVSHKRPGFYFRVLEEGEISAGDEIVKVAEGPEQVTVAEIDGLLYLPGHSPEQLRRTLRIPSLSAGWKGSLEALLADEGKDKQGNAGLAASSAPPAWRGFRPLRVAAVQPESVGVRSFVLEAEDRSPLSAPLPGQFLVFKLELDAHSAPIMRSYSMSGPQGTGTYRISVKRAGGVGSHYFHDHIQAGELLQVSAPRGSFTLAAGDGPVVLLSAGIGVTPVLSMLHALAAGAAGSMREIWWCYGARNRDEHTFAAEAHQLLAHLPHSRSFIAYSKPAEGDQQGKDYDAPGHLSLSLLQPLHLPQAADYYLCGPSAFLAGLTAALQAWGVPYARIHSETFGTEPPVTPGIAMTAPAKPHPPAETPGTGPEVSFTRSGLSVPWDPRFQSLLELAEACEVPVRWSCRTGVCHMCESGLIDGQVRYAPDPLDKPADGNVLICCSTPLARIELDL
jgi:ferredoxin-NADP reductase/ferredoxin